MERLLATPCSKCGRANEAGARVCALCGNLLRRGESDSAIGAEAPRARTIALHSPVESGKHDGARESAVSHSPTTLASLRAMIPSHDEHASSAHSTRASVAATSTPSRPALVRASPTTERRASKVPASTREPWIYLAIGLATAPIFAWTPILQYMGWFLASLVHEMGHATLAWVCGMPAMPAISLAGEAAAVHSDQLLVLVGAIVLVVVSTLWRVLEGRARIVAVSAFGVLYPALAFTSAKELLHLLAGHCGELAFATLCLWKTLDGGFTESRVERGLYGTVGWYLLGKNVVLCFGLMSSASARAEYASSGSFGLTNDMIRAAEDVLGWRLESVALLMLVAGALVLPAAIGLWRATVAMRANALES